MFKYICSNYYYHRRAKNVKTEPIASSKRQPDGTEPEPFEPTEDEWDVCSRRFEKQRTVSIKT